MNLSKGNLSKGNLSKGNLSKGNLSKGNSVKGHSTQRRAALIPAFKRLPLPLFEIARKDYSLTPLNYAAKHMQAAHELHGAGHHKRCHQLFFGRESPCLHCTLANVTPDGAPQNCALHHPDSVFLEPWSAENVLAYPLIETVALQDLLSVNESIRPPYSGALQSSEKVAKNPDLSDQLSADILAQMGCGTVLIGSDDQKIRFINAFGTQLLGCDAPSAIGKRMEQLIPGFKIVADAQQRTLEYRRPESKTIDLGYRCIACAPDALDGTIITFRDVTETKRNREESENNRRMLEIGRLCTVVAHEFRNPLAGIKATVQSIEKAANDAGLDGPLGLIHAEVDRLTALLAGFSSLVRHSAPQKKWVDFPTLILNARALAGPHLDHIRFDAQYRTRKKAWVDPHQIQQVLLNLIINAAQAQPSGGVIRIRADHDDEGVLLSIEDDGSGITAEDRDNIFDAFFTTKPEGTGLGLSVSHRIVAAHGGRIDLDKQTQGRGARFVISLPQQDSERSQ